MNAMILAAGLGKRLKPITNKIPKPLIEIDGVSPLKRHLEKLDKANFKNVTINVSHLGYKICKKFGNSFGKNLRIRYSFEPSRPLETAGGIAFAEPWNENWEPFLVINGDIFCNWDFTEAHKLASEIKSRKILACLIMVSGRKNHIGDFFLDTETNLLCHREPQNSGRKKLVFSGLGVYDPNLFNFVKKGFEQALKPIFDKAINRNLIIGKKFDGNWIDIGSHESLKKLKY